MMKFISAIFFSFLIFGCGGGNQAVNVNLKCDGDCNDNNAVVVRIYQLKNADKFKYASFESLIRNPEGTLSDDLIPDSKFEVTLVPGQVYQIENYVLKDGAEYIGVLGDFHSPAKDGWLQVIPVKPDINSMKVTIHHNSLTAEKVN